jgi:uncharacterized membrane protein YkoI
MKRVAIAIILTLAASTAYAQTPPKKKLPPGSTKPVVHKTAQMPSVPPLREMRPGLEAKAKVKADSATKMALDAMPKGTIESRTIEERGGRLIYAFGMRAADKTTHDVIVDAMTGKIVPMPKTGAKKKKG